MLALWLPPDILRIMTSEHAVNVGSQDGHFCEMTSDKQQPSQPTMLVESCSLQPRLCAYVPELTFFHQQHRTMHFLCAIRASPQLFPLIRVF